MIFFENYFHLVVDKVIDNNYHLVIPTITERFLNLKRSTDNHSNIPAYFPTNRRFFYSQIAKNPYNKTFQKT